MLQAPILIMHHFLISTMMFSFASIINITESIYSVFTVVTTATVVTTVTIVTTVVTVCICALLACIWCIATDYGIKYCLVTWTCYITLISYIV